MNFKQKILLNLCKTIYKPIEIKEFIDVQDIKVKSSDINVLKETTFNIFEIEFTGQKKYFRECRKHVLFKEYIKEVIEDYYYLLNLSNDLIINKEIVINTLLSKKTLKKIYNMGIANDSKSLTAKFFNSKDLHILNLENLSILPIVDILDLIQYLWGEVYSYRLNDGLKVGNFQTFNYSKIISTSKLSSLLNIDNLFPKVEIAKLIIDDNIIKYGIIMNGVDGISPNKLSLKERNKIAPNFQKDCSTLNIIDALANEKDHRPGNYYVKIINNQVNSLEAFDNDSPMCFFLTTNIKLITYLNSTPLLDDDGIITIPHIDRALYNKIMKVNKDDLNTTFSKSLTKIQTEFLWLRLCKLKKALVKTTSANPKFLLEDNEWSYDTIREELDNAKINSYLTIFCKSNLIENNYDNKTLI